MVKSVASITLTLPLEEALDVLPCLAMAVHELDQEPYAAKQLAELASVIRLALCEQPQDE